jgi:leader peptidase (prepilin peptidase)/N-methyltransferase
MPIVIWSLVGLFCALLINRAADCWLNPQRLQCGLTNHPVREKLVLVGVPVVFSIFAGLIDDPRLLWFGLLSSVVLILLMVIDLEQRRIPDVVVFPAFGLTLIIQWQFGRFSEALAGLALALTAFWLLYAVGRRIYGSGAMGIGDVKLAALLGALLGLRLAPTALLLGILLAGIVSAFLLATNRITWRSTIPYGVFLAAGGLLILFGRVMGFAP